MNRLTANPRDYIGRRADLLAFDDFRTKGDTLLTQALVSPDSTGAVIAGIEKLAQRFLLELLTEYGTTAGIPDRGCQFMRDARQGRWRTPADVRRSFSSSMLQVRRSLVRDWVPSDPRDELFSEAEMLDVVVSGDFVSVRIALTSLAGETRVILYPMRTTFY